ncbi:hypothetical protein H1R20_g8019, partial [Candolleomyces eurysporus]
MFGSASEALSLDHESALPKPAHIEGPANVFNLRRRYYSTSLPTHDPEGWIDLDSLYDSTYHSNTLEESTHDATAVIPLHSLGPFPNLSSFKLGEWYIDSGPQLSMVKLQKLVQLAQTPGFAEDIAKANWPQIFDALGNNQSLNHVENADDEEAWVDDEGWKTTPVHISVPIRGAVETRNVGTLYHRSIVSILQDKILNSSDMEHFHYDPFEVLWQPDPDTPAMRVHSELYNSDAFLQAHRELQDSPPPPGCTRPRVVASLMFWSDKTHLTSFSDEKLWPLYMFFGNESKYRRCKPSSNLCHHVAFFDKLSPDFKDYITRKTGGRIPPKSFMSHCKNEMFHAQWEILLDDELLEAIRHGIVIMCQDGIERRFYIQIFTYSADYPEKVLIATIRSNGACPCPRCLISAENLDQLENVSDFKRKAARDYEQLLQCAIPVFDGLVPNEEHNREILLILSSCAKWHTLAKLRFHTDATLNLLDEATVEIGNSFRRFIDNVCSQVQTKELAIEVAKRVKREQKKAAKKTKTAKEDKGTTGESGPSTESALSSPVLEAAGPTGPLPLQTETATRVIKANKSRSGRSVLCLTAENKVKIRSKGGVADLGEKL